MCVSIGDIAEKCGLSTEIVARVLNDCADIGEQSRRQVLEAARALGYPIGERVAGSRTHNLGVLFADESYSGLTHPFFASMLNAFKAEAELHGYDVTFINHSTGAGGETFLQHCRRRNVDGVCLACVDFYAPEVEELLDSDVPCVTVDHPWPNTPCVISDNRSGIRMLVDYAVSMGHRRIAFLSGQMNSEVTKTRTMEFRAAMKAHDLKLPEGWLIEARYDDGPLVGKLVSQLIGLRDRPTCILLPDDACYFGAQEAIREHELRIPADISVAGYDGIRLTQTLRPQLTTIRQDSEAMGREAAMRLIGSLEGSNGEEPGVITIPVELIKGATMSWCNAW